MFLLRRYSVSIAVLSFCWFSEMLFANSLGWSYVVVSNHLESALIIRTKRTIIGKTNITNV